MPRRSTAYRLPALRACSHRDKEVSRGQPKSTDPSAPERRRHAPRRRIDRHRQRRRAAPDRRAARIRRSPPTRACRSPTTRTRCGPIRAGRRCSKTSSCARRSPTSTTSGSPSASSTRAARAAHGYFELTASLAEYTTAKILTEVGERTPVFTRFSTVAGGAGSVDTPRDVRGFAVKFYTKEGNWDLVGNNIPVFFIQDAIKFPDLVHAVKMEPDRGFPQSATAHDTFWDFISLTPESMHMVMWIMSDRTLPRSLRMIEGFGVHSFRLRQRGRQVDLRQVPLAAQARPAVDDLGRGGEDRRRRPGLPPPRPVRGDRRRATFPRGSSRCSCSPRRRPPPSRSTTSTRPS